jgi:hypothetical protein
MDAEAESTFLEEGAKTYFEAETAIQAFRELVQSRCRKVVLKHLPDYGAALGKQLDGAGVTEFAWREASGAELGAKIEIGGYNELHHVLGWDPAGKPSVYIGAYLYSYRRRAFHSARIELIRAEHTLEVFNNDSIWLYEQLDPADFGLFDIKLDSILIRWIEIWKKVGGVKILASEKDEADD